MRFCALKLNIKYHKTLHNTHSTVVRYSEKYIYKRENILNKYMIEENLKNQVFWKIKTLFKTLSRF